MLTETALQIEQKTLKKTKLKNPNLFLKTNIFKNQNRLRITTKN